MRTRSFVRRGLVVFQFGVAIIMVVATLGVQQQLYYMQARPLGFSKDLLVTMPLFQMARHTKHYEGNVFLARDYHTVKQAFHGNPGVLQATASRRTMGSQGYGPLRDVYGEGQQERPLRMQIHSTDTDFLDVYQIPLIAGRNYNSAQTEGSTGEMQVVINRTAARQFGWEAPVGKHFFWVENTNRHVPCLVVGVMEDFHTTSLREPIPPLAFNLEPSVFNLITVRIRSSNIPQTLSFLKETWEHFLPSRPFTYAFVDENLDRANQDDRRFGTALSAVSALAILIACLGLLGLAAFVVKSRTREIGIRKVLGASEVNIWWLLTSQLTRAVLVAGGVALPIGYALVDSWLQGFAYRTSQNPIPYLVSTLGMFGLALLVVSIFATRSARANPVEALRHE